MWELPLWPNDTKDPHLAYIKAENDWIIFYPTSYQEAILLTETMHKKSIVIVSVNKRKIIYQRYIDES